MSKEINKHKRTFGVGRTKITTHLPDDHPVYKGVMHAMKIEGDEFPEHVGRILIRPDIVPASQKDTFVAGNCQQTDQGGSVINIFAGSINEVVDRYLVESETTNVTLHEVGHSLRGKEIQEGGWLGEKSSRKWEESDAENYVVQARRAYQQRQAEKRKGQPRMTVRRVLEIRKAEQLGN